MNLTMFILLEIRQGQLLNLDALVGVDCRKAAPSASPLIGRARWYCSTIWR